jgi:Asp/Glu/hydantoin racemase
MRLVYLKTSGVQLDADYSREMLQMMQAEGVMDGIDCDFDPGPDVPVVQGRAAMRRYEAGILERVRKWVESRKYDAIVLQSVLDPALFAAREISPIPVLGCAESAVHLASMLGSRFSFLCTVPVEIKMLPQHVAVYGLSQKLASVRCINLPVPDVKLRKTPRAVLDAMEDAAVKAIENDGAEVLILGCTGLSWMAPDLRRRLAERDLPAPVIQPVWAAVAFARMLVTLGMRHSPLAYPPAVDEYPLAPAAPTSPPVPDKSAAKVMQALVPHR